jgi:hypothetical protein
LNAVTYDAHLPLVRSCVGRSCSRDDAYRLLRAQTMQRRTAKTERRAAPAVQSEGTYPSPVGMFLAALAVTNASHPSKALLPWLPACVRFPRSKNSPAFRVRHLPHGPHRPLEIRPRSPRSRLPYLSSSPLDVRAAATSLCKSPALLALWMRLQQRCRAPFLRTLASLLSQWSSGSPCGLNSRPCVLPPPFRRVRFI